MAQEAWELLNQVHKADGVVSHKSILKEAKTATERKEITYGFVVHEFELTQAAKNKRPPLPGFSAKFSSHPRIADMLRAEH